MLMSLDTSPRSADAPPASGQPTISPPRRRRWARWVGLSAAAVVALGIASAVMDRTVLRHDLLSADFESGARPFTVGADFGTVSEVVDGTYRIRTLQPDVGIVSSAAPFTRVAFNVVVSADLVEVDLGDEPGAVGVACIDGDRHAGYALLAGNGGGVVIRRYDEQGETDLLRDDASLPAPPYRLTLSCRVESPGGTVALAGSVDGTEIVRGEDPEGIVRFSGTRLVLASDVAGVLARYDNVEAVVPG
jgi:hypothetical protein